MYDIGDTIPLSVEIKNSSGVLTNPVSIALTVRRDYDNTTDNLTPTQVSTGVYRYDYVPDVPGRHIFRWSSTTPSASFNDVYNVVTEGYGIVSLAAAKRYLSIPADDTSVDEELRVIIAGVTSSIEDVVGPIRRITVTEKHSGGRAAIALNRSPIISVTSVVENGVTLTADDYSLNYGVLTRMAGAYTESRWASGTNNITVVYVVGRAEMPPGFGLAARDLIAINGRRLQGGNRDSYDRNPQPDGRDHLGYFLPNGVLRLLSSEELPPGIA